MSALSTLPLYQGILYRISNDENKETEATGYLAGACHAFVPPDQDCSFNEEMNRAIQNSETVYLESSPFGGIENMDSINVNALEAFNFTTGIERKILNIVLTIKKKLKGLESLEEHQAIELRIKEALQNLSTDFFKLSQEEQQTIDRIYKKILYIPNLITLVYKYGDKQLLKSLTSVLFPTQALRQAHLWDRNPKMAEKIHLSLKNKERPFIAVGSSHLWSTKTLGEEGVVKLLRKKGWKVERIQSPGDSKNFLDECTKHFLNVHTTINPEQAASEISRIVDEIKAAI